MIVYNLASFPKREKEMKVAVESVYDQADIINIYLNSYSEIPKFLSRKKINCVVGGKDIGDLGKFYFLDQYRESYYFTIDDDIQYPSNYTKVLSEKIRKYDDDVLLCVHANNISHLNLDDLSSYYKCRKNISFVAKVHKDKFIDIPGTGTVAFYNRKEYDFQIALNYKNNADLWLAYHAELNSISRICISRNKHWLNPIPHFEKDTIARRAAKDDRIPTAFAKDILKLIRDRNA